MRVVHHITEASGTIVSQYMQMNHKKGKGGWGKSRYGQWKSWVAWWRWVAEGHLLHNGAVPLICIAPVHAVLFFISDTWLWQQEVGLEWVWRRGASVGHVTFAAGQGAVEAVHTCQSYWNPSVQCVWSAWKPTAWLCLNKTLLFLQMDQLILWVWRVEMRQKLLILFDWLFPVSDKSAPGIFSFNIHKHSISLDWADTSQPKGDSLQMVAAPSVGCGGYKISLVFNSQPFN